MKPSKVETKQIQTPAGSKAVTVISRPSEPSLEGRIAALEARITALENTLGGSKPK